MQLNKIDDPRDPLQKATRYQVWQFAKANGLEFPEDAPAPVIRAALRARGLTRIPVPPRVLGAINSPSGAAAMPPPGAKILTRDADEDIAEQWLRQQERERQEASAQPAGLADMGINELRKECGRLGIKLGRKDNMQSMREKITAHGQNAS